MLFGSVVGQVLVSENEPANPPGFSDPAQFCEVALLRRDGHRLDICRTAGSAVVTARRGGGLRVILAGL